MLYRTIGEVGGGGDFMLAYVAYDMLCTIFLRYRRPGGYFMLAYGRQGGTLYAS